MAIPTTNWQITLLGGGGYQAIGEVSATQLHPLGTTIRARDVNYGEGEFIYLLGVASTAAGDAVCYNSKTGVTVRAVDGGGTSIGAFAVAMAAIGAGQYGWYQISGSGPINSATASANTQAYLSATDGQIDDTGTTPIAGLTLTAAASGGFATVQMDRPSVSAASGGGSVAFAAVGSTPNSAGGSAAGSTITLQPADGTHPGVVTSGTQTIGGAKTFSGNVIAESFYASTTLHGFSYSAANTVVSAPTAGAALFQDSQNGAHWALVNVNGVEVDVVGQSFILKSPDGTRWKLAVADTTGALTAVLA
jgi:hypothetical protein